MRPEIKELIVIAACAAWTVFWNNRILEMIGLLVLWAVILRLRVIIKSNNITDKGGWLS